MPRLRILIPTLAITALVLAGCRPAGPAVNAPPPVPPATTATTTAATTASSTATVSPWPDNGPAGILAAISTQHFPDHDRVVFQFHGATAPEVTVGYVREVTEDASGRPVPLLGKAFVTVVFHGARLDNSAVASDPSTVVRYSGPTRLTPRYAVLQELAVSGDFEAVLSFGLGLSTKARLDRSAPAGSGRVILDLWPAT